MKAFGAKSKRGAHSVLVQLAALLAGLVILFPIIFCVCSAFKNEYQILNGSGQLFPRQITWENFRRVFEQTPIIRYMFNSLFIAVTASAVRILFSSMAGFAFSFMEFPLKNFWFLLLLGTMMIPADVTLVSNYFVVAKLNLVGTYTGVMIVYFVNALNVFMFRQYFKSVSSEIRDASKVDGCGDFRFFVSILMPISKPTIATAFISSFVSMWNIYTWPLLVTKTNEMRTVQVAITMLTASESSTAYGAVMAGTLVILLPAAVVFLAFRKWIIEGVTAGSIKG